MELLFFALCIIIVMGVINRLKERFDGVGKGFAMYYHPRKCCKSQRCYPGMYLGNDFWRKN